MSRWLLNSSNQWFRRSNSRKCLFTAHALIQLRLLRLYSLSIHLFIVIMAVICRLDRILIYFAFILLVSLSFLSPSIVLRLRFGFVATAWLHVCSLVRPECERARTMRFHFFASTKSHPLWQRTIHCALYRFALSFSRLQSWFYSSHQTYFASVLFTIFVFCFVQWTKLWKFET